MTEFPGLILAALLVDRVGRKLLMGGFVLLCFAFIAPVAVPLGEGLATTLLFSARACIMGSYAVLYIYGPEVSTFVASHMILYIYMLIFANT